MRYRLRPRERSRNFSSRHGPAAGGTLGSRNPVRRVPSSTGAALEARADGGTGRAGRTTMTARRMLVLCAVLGFTCIAHAKCVDTGGFDDAQRAVDAVVRLGLPKVG